MNCHVSGSVSSGMFESTKWLPVGWTLGASVRGRCRNFYARRLCWFGVWYNPPCYSTGVLAIRRRKRPKHEAYQIARNFKSKRLICLNSNFMHGSRNNCTFVWACTAPSLVPDLQLELFRTKFGGSFHISLFLLLIQHECSSFVCGWHPVWIWEL
jgi:hypothetical protein